MDEMEKPELYIVKPSLLKSVTLQLMVKLNQETGSSLVQRISHCANFLFFFINNYCLATNAKCKRESGLSKIEQSNMVSLHILEQIMSQYRNIISR
jgi:hypothetical protein